MLEITINGEKKSLSDASLHGLLRAENVPQDHWKALAIARNGSIVPKSTWDDVRLANGDAIEIVMPFAGG
jgi:thiamine biosynthesis protein ThiS